MLRYHVRSRDLVGLVGDIKEKKLILSPYFQRNLVWREIHKKDFIETILLGLPFPQIFIAQGEIDVDTMSSKACIVDGQQRLSAIADFVENKFSVGGKLFSGLSKDEQEEFLRYQVPVIDLEIKADDPAIIDIFKRLNRTFYALSAIEKMATEFATVDLMLVAKLMCGIFDKSADQELDEQVGLDAHPFMPVEFTDWSRGVIVDSYRNYILNNNIFAPQEVSRLVHLMYTLNLISTIYGGFFARNELTHELLEKGDFNFPFRGQIVALMNRSSKLLTSLNFPKESMWWSKSNSFSLSVLFAWNIVELEAMPLFELQKKLIEFEENLSDDYALAAREAVNNRKQRIARHDAIASALSISDAERPLSTDV